MHPMRANAAPLDGVHRTRLFLDFIEKILDDRICKQFAAHVGRRLLCVFHAGRVQRDLKVLTGPDALGSSEPKRVQRSVNSLTLRIVHDGLEQDVDARQVFHRTSSAAPIRRRLGRTLRDTFRSCAR